MTVFDVDGTLVGGEPTDWDCFESAFEEVADFSLSQDFFANLKEVTGTKNSGRKAPHQPSSIWSPPPFGKSEMPSPIPETSENE